MMQSLPLVWPWRSLPGAAWTQRVDAMLRSAVERQAEIVGEACRRALTDSPELRERLPDMARAMAMRSRIAHGYDLIDDAIVFETVRVHFPPLADGLERELASFRAP